jgi:hypothetical protein
MTSFLFANRLAKRKEKDGVIQRLLRLAQDATGHRTARKVRVDQKDVQARRRETTRKAGILSGSSEVLAKELRFNE